MLGSLKEHTYQTADSYKYLRVFPDERFSKVALFESLQ